jgi:hypothetical protein
MRVETSVAAKPLKQKEYVKKESFPLFRRALNVTYTRTLQRFAKPNQES